MRRWPLQTAPWKPSSYYAIDASSRLAKERGAYASFSGSLWSRGILPIDSLRMLRQERGEDYLDVNFDTTP